MPGLSLSTQGGVRVRPPGWWPRWPVSACPRSRPRRPVEACDRPVGLVGPAHGG